MIRYRALSPAQHHGAPLVFSDIRSYTNLLFTLLFTIECLLKITSFGCRVTTVCLCVSGYVLVSTKYLWHVRTVTYPEQTQIWLF